jgi:TRAP-type mannitol/chloroaromatic compound transport system permease small subunit
LERLLAASAAIESALHRISMAAGWLFVVCTLVIVFDVLTRKFGFQLPGMGSTRLQELEWHLHTALFCFWLGSAYPRTRTCASTSW